MHVFVRALVLFWKSFFVAFARISAFLLALFVFLFVIGVAVSGGEQESALNGVNTTLPLKHESGSVDSSNKLVIIPIRGVILSERATDPLSNWLETQVTYGYEIKKLLSELAKQDEVKGVLLNIDSPGGTVVGAKAIADGIELYRQQTGKPVFAYVGGMAASGAYWAMAGTDRIIADTGTSIGSIGVIFGPFKYYDGVVEENYGALTGGVVTQKGIETQYITAGTSKDIGSPYRQMTPAERQILQQGVNDAYQSFVQHVATTRTIPEDTIINTIGAMIYGEQQAISLKLIDAVGSKDTAEQELANRLNLPEGSYEFITPTSELGFLSTLMSTTQFWSTQRATGMGCPLAATVMAYHGDMANFCH